jgi:hypothetical protein
MMKILTWIFIAFVLGLILVGWAWSYDVSDVQVK